MSYGNIYWYFSSARLDFALLVDRQMQQGKCRIGIRGDICVFCFRDYWRRLAVWAGRNHIEYSFDYRLFSGIFRLGSR